MQILNSFKFIDIIGKEIQFKIENSEKYKTSFGGILTITLGIISLISLWFFGNDVIYKLSPKIITNELYLDQTEYHILNNSNYFFAIRFSDYNGVIIDDPRFLIPKFVYTLYEINTESGELDTTFSEAIKMVKCNTSHIDNETLHSELLEFYYCATLNNYTAGGNWDSDKYGELFYSAEVCSEDTEIEKNITCATKEEVTEKYQDYLYIDIKYFNSIINPSNYKKPIKRTLEYQYQALDRRFYKDNKLYYTNSILATDEGLIFEDIKTQNLFQIQKWSLDLGASPDNVLWACSIYFSKLRKDFKRSYIKVQDVAATVGGFFSISFYFFRAIYYFYIEVHLQYYYYDKLLSFQYDKENERDRSSKKVLDLKADKGENDKIEICTIIPFQSSEIKIVDTHLSKENVSTYSKTSKSKLNLLFDPSNIPNPHTNNTPNTPSFPDKRTENRTNTSHIITNNALGNNFSRRLSGLIDHTKKKRETYNILFCELFCYKYLFCCKFDRDKANSRVKNQLIYQAEYEIDKKVDTLKILHIFEQFAILKKILLNENQCYMLDNKGKKIIYNKKISSKLDFSKVIEEKKSKMEERLVDYLKDKKEKNQLSEVDMLLYNLMEDEIKEKICEKVQI